MFFWKNSEEKQYEDFQLHEDSLIYKGKRHTFSEITHLHFSRVITQFTTVTVLAEYSRLNEFILYIYLIDGTTIKLEFSEKYASMMKEKIEHLSALYQFLAQKTFAQRLQFYMSQVTQGGYFKYGGCNFYPTEKKIVFKNKDFYVQSSSFMKGAGFIELRPKDWTIFQRIKREATLTTIPQFSLSKDTDVIFYILDKSFGLRWD
ncbi:hypothetical protein [Methylomicrobium lacus]|uniref:hypothetical protein n=1 Tax=Methylomicrobium lacus TaxID=136992 RepID=UPI00045E6ADD|nr:hypothetical protein [Methylomicrobium lacus]